MTADVFIDFFKRLITARDKPVYPVVDGHPVHRSARVAKFVEHRKDTASEGQRESEQALEMFVCLRRS